MGFTDDVPETAVGSTFTGHEYERILTHEQWKWDPQQFPKHRW
jgi:hypothetical protein